MAHQYMPKIFHDPYKNPPAPPSYIFNVRSLKLLVWRMETNIETDRYICIANQLTGFGSSLTLLLIRVRFIFLKRYRENVLFRNFMFGE